VTARLHHVNPDFFTIIGKGYMSSNGQMAFFTFKQCILRLRLSEGKNGHC